MINFDAILNANETRTANPKNLPSGKYQATVSGVNLSEKSGIPTVWINFTVKNDKINGSSSLRCEPGRVDKKGFADAYSIRDFISIFNPENGMRFYEAYEKSVRAVAKKSESDFIAAKDAMFSICSTVEGLEFYGNFKWNKSNDGRMFLNYRTDDTEVAPMPVDTTEEPAETKSPSRRTLVKK